ncbi:MAG TPA: 16S rRNA (guanine(966)-N(2))-methyltransferase RsmD [Candidatus Dojkabacteria bacterium]|nr:16S rRNA (guanine(966)-N(2))-methyltransferase RsmD [Candidatus Dojkabacteria bacterium]
MSRITAGIAKNTRLLVADGITRPITDRIKISLFDTLSPVLANATCLDLFAGSGAIGLEALSRGAKHVTFVENDSEAIKLILENGKKTNLENQIDVLEMRVQDYLKNCRNRFELIFIDPPFPLKLEEKLEVVKSSLMVTKVNGYIIFRYPSKEIYPETININALIGQNVWQKKYGLSKITIFERTN